MDVFTITPASPKPLWFLAVACVLLLVILLALVYTAYSSRNSHVAIEGDRIKLTGDFWGREIPFELLDIPGARILDITGNTDYSPRRRTFGTGLPGYASGWFRLRNGEKALIYLTNRSDVVYIPTLDGYSLLLSIEEPERFIATLQKYNTF
jgi:hypothetical protein